MNDITPFRVLTFKKIEEDPRDLELQWLRESNRKLAELAESLKHDMTRLPTNYRVSVGTMNLLRDIYPGRWKTKPW